MPSYRASTVSFNPWLFFNKRLAFRLRDWFLVGTHYTIPVDT
jgi:hypothetical protein